MNLFGKKILIAEDEEMLAEVIREELVFRGAEVQVAHHGLAALEIMKSFKPDVILSDYRMPKMNGKEFLHQARSTFKAEMPFVFLSAFSDIAMQDVYQSGADAFIAKPCHMDDLASAVSYYAQNRFERWKAVGPTLNEEKSKVQIDRKLGSAWRHRICFGMNGFFFAEDIPSLGVDELMQFRFEIAYSPGASFQFEGLGRSRFFTSKGVGIELLQIHNRIDIESLLQLMPACIERIPAGLE